MTHENRFGPVAIALHWIVAAAILVVLCFAWTVETLDRGETKDLALTIHKSVGLLIFIVMVPRLAWRLTHRPPPLPPETPAWQRAGARLGHAFLYAIAFVMPVTGYISVAARGRETTFFGLFVVPQWAPLDRMLSLSMEKAHRYGQYALYGLIAAHVGAALYHRFVLRDRVLARMWPFGAGTQ
jgi:cytochrome b561